MHVHVHDIQSYVHVPELVSRVSIMSTMNMEPSKVYMDPLHQDFLHNKIGSLASWLVLRTHAIGLACPALLPLVETCLYSILLQWKHCWWPSSCMVASFFLSAIPLARKYCSDLSIYTDQLLLGRTITKEVSPFLCLQVQFIQQLIIIHKHTHYIDYDYTINDTSMTTSDEIIMTQ